MTFVFDDQAAEETVNQIQQTLDNLGVDTLEIMTEKATAEDIAYAREQGVSA